MPNKTPGSIFQRLLLSGLCTLPVLLLLTGIAIDRAYSHSLLNAEYDRLRLQFFGLLGAMEWQEGHLTMSERLQESRFTQFRSGLYAAVTTDQGRPLWRSLSTESLALPALPSPSEAGRAELGDVVVDSQPHFSYRYLAIWENERGDETPLVFSLYAEKNTFTTELHRFRQQLTLWLGSVLILAMLLMAGILYWGLRPLRKLAHDLANLEQGRTIALDEHYPRELTGVTSNLNLLLDKEQQQRERYRNTMADLAHSLKTPLAVLQSHHLSDHERQEQLQRMEHIVAYQLQRAVGLSRKSSLHRLALTPTLQRLTDTMLKVYRDKDINIEIDTGDARLAMDEQDCMELFGNILDNACKACQGRVRLSSENLDAILLLHIDDDGPGIDEHQRQTLLQRGRRGDQYSSGQGIGLAVVMDIIDSYGAEISVARAPVLGGARITLHFPL